MTDTELDRVYTALAEALGRVGQVNTPLLLSTLALALLADLPSANKGLSLIEKAQALALV